MNSKTQSGLTAACQRLFGYRVHFSAKTDPGQVRQGNEDNYLLHAQAGLFAVADGLGGLQAGDVASSMVLAHLKTLTADHLHQVQSPGASQRHLGQLHQAIATVNKRTHEHSNTSGITMATTLAMVQFHACGIFIAHVGDSRVYLWREEQLHRLTSDHSLVNELLNQGTLTVQEAVRSPYRHVITRAIGASPVVSPSIQEQSIHAGDVLLLCTDGLTTMVTDTDIARIIGNGHGAAAPIVEPIVDQLVAAANQAGGHDNITVLLLVIEAAEM
jgi:PPM family protein phosphatase